MKWISVKCGHCQRHKIICVTLGNFCSSLSLTPYTLPVSIHCILKVARHCLSYRPLFSSTLNFFVFAVCFAFRSNPLSMQTLIACACIVINFWNLITNNKTMFDPQHCIWPEIPRKDAKSYRKIEILRKRVN